MTEKNTKTELLAAFQSLSETIPEMRTGQLIAAVGELCADLHGRGLWDAADEELLEAVWQFHRNFEKASVAELNGEQREQSDEDDERDREHDAARRVPASGAP